MISLKIQCGCGQRYAFEVEPVGGKMPAQVVCPVCGADGTAAANDLISQSLPAPAVVPPPVPAAQFRIPTAATATDTPVQSGRFALPLSATPTEHAPARESDNWKWWYYILAGICIGGFDIWKTYDTGRIKYLNGLFLSVLLIAIGVWDFQRKRKNSAGG